VTLDSQTLRRVDRLVRDARYPNRSQAIEAPIRADLERLAARHIAAWPMSAAGSIQRRRGPSSTIIRRPAVARSAIHPGEQLAEALTALGMSGR
jgi:Arc/MetJ-type ribon-helix-helix transcriptional regulator